MARPLLLCWATALAALLVPSRQALADLPQAGDIVFGLSTNSTTTSLELARGAATMSAGTQVTDPWDTDAFLQSVEFDNLGGVKHNANGNLLAVNFGTGATGGSIYSLATRVDPAPAAQLIGNTTGTGGTLSLSRLGGLSVSPDNAKIAVTGYEPGTVIVFDYTPGDGMGAGASLAGARASAATLPASSTQGTGWLNSSTVLAFSTEGKLFTVDATSMAVAEVANAMNTPVGSNFTALAYNPDIAPYIYATYSGFSGTGMSKLFVFDPANSYALVKSVDLSGSVQTAREIALDADGNLFIGAFGGTGTNGATIEFIPAANVLSPATLTDNSTVDWYQSTTFSSFNGMDLALGGGAVEEDADFDGDGDIDGADFLSWQRNLGLASGATLAQGDADGNGAVNAADLAIWRGQFATAVPAANSIPEPGGLTLSLVGLAWAARLRRRYADSHGTTCV
jgi:hypothetical protein